MSSWAARPVVLATTALCLACALRGQGVTATAWQDFGSVAVGAASGSVIIDFSVASGVGTPSFRTAFGTEFHAGGAACNASVCQVPVTFQPFAAGLRQDALEALDSQGNPLAVTKLKGIGLAPELRVLPAALSAFAGTGVWGGGGDGGQASAATLGNPQAVAVDASGGIYIADSLDDTVRYVTSAGVISTFAGTGRPGFAGDGGQATAAELDTPTGIALDAAGDLFIADSRNQRIRRVDAVLHLITTVAGNGTPSFGGDGGPATSASLDGPTALAIDASGAFYIADTYNNRIRKVDASGSISTVVGGGTESLAGVTSSVAGTSLALLSPAGLAVDASGSLYIADSGDQMVVKLTSAGASVIAGSGTPGFSGDGGPATSAQLQGPSGLAVDAAGDVYISDSNNSVVRLVAGGQIDTIAGNPGQFGYGGDGGSAAQSVFNNPAGIALDNGGRLYVADQGNRRVRRLDFSGAGLSFGSSVAGVLSNAQTLSIVNAGNQTSAVSAVTVSSNFVQQASGRLDCAAAISLQPSGTCAVAIAFAPTTTGSITGTLQLTDNSGNSTSQHTVELTGLAIAGAAPGISIAPATVTFASQPLGSISAAQTVTIGNGGSGTLLVGGLSLSGANASDFQLISSCGSSIASNSSCTVAISFVPHGLGTRSATLIVNDDAVGSPHEVSLSGSGASGPAWIGAMPVTVFGTGLTSTGTLAAEGSVDTHWTITSAADWKHPGPKAYAVTSASLPSGWAANGPNSNWIAPTSTGNLALAAGQYVYHTSFDLTGLDASTALLSGTLAAGGSVAAMVNGVPALSMAGGGTQTAFRINTGFVSGRNTLDFIVTASVAGATGFRLEISGTAQRIAAVPIAVFGTGVTKAGSLASVGAVDQNYTLETSGSAASTYVVPTTGTWTANGPYSQWISPSSGAGSAAGAGTYVYRTSFDLTGLNAATAILIGQIATDDSVTVKLNGTAIPALNVAGAATPAPFVIRSGFAGGVNILEFTLTHTTASASGLRVDLSGSAQPAGSAAIAVWGTGAGSAGLSADGSIDAHWQLETGGLIAAPGPAAYVVPSGALTSSWAADGPSSKWIAPGPAASSSFAAGNYTYRTTFDLTGLNTATAVLNGQLAANGMVTAILNGIPVPRMPASSASAAQPFTITSGFVSGVNVLEFAVLTNTAGAPGLKVDLAGTAQSEFGSGTAWLGATAIDFSGQRLGTSSGIQSVTIANTGTTALQISGIFPNGPAVNDFSVTTTCTASLIPGGTCAISATFAPTAAGLRTAFVTLTDGSGDSPEIFTLSGGAAPVPTGPMRTERLRARPARNMDAPAGERRIRSGIRALVDHDETAVSQQATSVGSEDRTGLGKNEREEERAGVITLSRALPQTHSGGKAMRRAVHPMLYRGVLEGCCYWEEDCSRQRLVRDGGCGLPEQEP